MNILLLLPLFATAVEKLRNQGRRQEFDAGLHAPLTQGAVITRRGERNPAAARFLRFLRGPEARVIFERFGYRVPQG